MTRIVVGRADIAAVEVLDEPPLPLADGQARLRVDRFGMSANNISYAMTGEFLGYWAHFPVDDARGCVPVWGFAEVVESRAELEVAERIFGYLPMATELIVQPSDVDALAFVDSIDHRRDGHRWYRRYYRCAADPAHDPARENLQATVWALFMTGWALAEELAAGSIRTVVASSASSKTALSLAWALQALDVEVDVVGLTSAANAAFVERSERYDSVRAYDGLSLDDLDGPLAYVDFAGNAGLKERIHLALGDRLVDSVIVGGTHQGGEPATGEPVGPAPRFFFIPDVAEGAPGGHAAFHERFAEALGRFTPWIEDLLHIEQAAGVDAVVGEYQALLTANPGPTRSTVLSW